MLALGEVGTGVFIFSFGLLGMVICLAIVLACLGVWTAKTKLWFIHIVRVGLLGMILGVGGCTISAICRMP